MDSHSNDSKEELLRLLERCLPYRDLLLQVELQGECLIVVFNLAAETRFSYEDLAEKLVARLYSTTLPNLQSLILYGRPWGMHECDWQRNFAFPLPSPELNAANPVSLTPSSRYPPPALVKLYRNVTEELAAAEVKRQL